jgi:hypothetical protein
MADSAAFELVCEVLERDTSLDRLEARGTVRLAIKSAGLEARSVTPDQMAVVVKNLLSRELETRGVDGDAVCAGLEGQLGGLEVSDVADTPEAVFSRLGGE